MSEFQAGDDPAARQPIAGVDDLIRYVASGAKPRSEWRVGTEYEKVGVLRESGLPSPLCIVVHALFAPEAHQAMLDAGAARVVSCDTVAHPTNAIAVAPLLGPAVLEIARA